MKIDRNVRPVPPTFLVNGCRIGEPYAICYNESGEHVALESQEIVVFMNSDQGYHFMVNLSNNYVRRVDTLATKIRLRKVEISIKLED
ncbi:hypothetical protein [Stenotrophomonas phage BUCT627]|uniref:Uncharacterized protein n=2 Tax=Bixiavirus TaxID=3044676 RepID=A0AC61N9V5_9CAUD|nr:hypothetical protein PQD76_gp41 [Stenotrophomonas phage BUCT626]YP_010677430.1 hypothetical protein PQD77_gp024 [Stenotrophomonas phage BUCT627]QYC96630.1 hypothetical protein [Stenotrophomonas phage BUCT627]QYC96745.1 hypothetical protein [Stenotrophomonas phage BUCT626]